MRRFVFFLLLCSLSLPVGLSITGCAKDNGQNFCSGFQTGPQVNATATITLQPETYGISVGYGQTFGVSAPTALNCKGASSGLTAFTYGTTNLQMADISPAGQVCGGEWNRNSGNGVADFTTCIPTKLSGIAYITASGGGATSNRVPVYVHPPVTSVVLNNGSNSGTTTCVSQNQTSQLNASVYSGSTDITSIAGHLTYSPQNSSIVTINQNGVATALQPGATVISATVAQATSTAGYFFTCPPKSIQLRVGNTNQTSVTVNANNVQPLTATVLDTLGNPIIGLTLNYSSNDPINIPVTSTGAVSPVYPSDAAITAQCLPGTCNPAPQDQIANLSAGVPVTSNPIEVHTPGPSSTILYMSSPQSYNFVPVDFQTGTVGTPIRLPYQPNSMVMDESGSNLFFGSATELMIVAISPTSGSNLTTIAPAVPGTVLAVAPDDSLVAIHDPCRQLFYLYTPGVGTTPASEISFGAPGPTIACNSNSEPIDPSVEVNPPYSAAFTQDSQTLYIVAGNVLYTYSKFTGWHTCTDNDQTGNCPVDSTSVTVPIPGVGAFAGGPTTTAFGYCAIGPNNTNPQQTAGPPPTGVNPDNALNPTEYYPSAIPAGVTLPATDQLAATTDGYHVIGATAAGELTDIQPTIPAGACPLKTALQFSFPTPPIQYSLATPNIQSIDQVLVSPDSHVSFVTFLPASSTGSNNTLPAFEVPCTAEQQAAGTCPTGQATAGKVVNIALTGNAGAPIGGTFSPDTTTFYVSTSGDDLVHFINTTSLTDFQQINPGLTCGTTTTAAANPFFACTRNNPVPAYFLAARPRPSQGSATSSGRASGDKN